MKNSENLTEEQKRVLTLVEKHNFLNRKIKYIKCTKIYEYDIQDAGFSVIKYKKLLSQQLITFLSNLNKNEKNIEIGKISIENKKLFSTILETFIKIRKKFALENNLEYSDILAIKKDSLFTFKQCNKLLIFNKYQFIKKGEYSSYLYLDNKEFYYNIADNNLIIKGLSNQEIHSSILDFIKKLLKLMEETENREKVFNYLKNFKEEYLNGELEINYYRELNNDGYYKIDNNIKLTGIEYLNYADDNLKELISNSYNYINIIRPLIGYVL
jgi:hypothetical protein